MAKKVKIFSGSVFSTEEEINKFLAEDGKSINVIDVKPVFSRNSDTIIMVYYEEL